jgi:hypothetical protein
LKNGNVDGELTETRLDEEEEDSAITNRFVSKRKNEEFINIVGVK